jgi:hypothetical protein
VCGVECEISGVRRRMEEDKVCAGKFRRNADFGDIAFEFDIDTIGGGKPSCRKLGRATNSRRKSRCTPKNHRVIPFVITI